MVEYTPVVSATHPARPRLRSGTKCIARADWPGQCGAAQRPEQHCSVTRFLVKAETARERVGHDHEAERTRSPYRYRWHGLSLLLNGTDELSVSGLVRIDVM
jgi:hypothetical protein